jgi:hypothetical protein
LFKELQRRNVFRVVMCFAVSSWLLLQVADMAVQVQHVRAMEANGELAPIPEYAED